MIASASFGSRRFVSLWVNAAAFLMRMTASTKDASGASWEMGKLRRARPVWTPDSASAGTGSSPTGTRPIRVALILDQASPLTDEKDRTYFGGPTRPLSVKRVY